MNQGRCAEVAIAIIVYPVGYTINCIHGILEEVELITGFKGICVQSSWFIVHSWRIRGIQDNYFGKYLPSWLNVISRLWIE